MKYAEQQIKQEKLNSLSAKQEKDCICESDENGILHPRKEPTMSCIDLMDGICPCDHSIMPEGKTCHCGYIGGQGYSKSEHKRPKKQPK